jgi:hypothetical protein
VDYDGGDQHYLLEYGRPQGVLRHANILGQLDQILLPLQRQPR